MAILVCNSVTPAWNFFDADKNELNENGQERTIAILNDDRSYTIKVFDFPLNKDWHIFIDNEEITPTYCHSLGECISWVEVVSTHKPFLLTKEGTKVCWES